jgi:hypothetical protein
MLVKEGVIEGKITPKRMPRPVKKEEEAPKVEEAAVPVETATAEATPVVESAPAETTTPAEVAPAEAPKTK